MDLLGVAFVAGLVINTTAGLMWRKANMADDDISFNALGYAIPILSLLFLFFFERADITRVDYLILALGGCGMVVYFRSDLFELLNIPSWSWSGDGYFGSIALSATVFTLLLAFRDARLVTRTSDEENRTFSILRKLDSLVRRDVINGEVRYCILVIDETNKQAG